VAQEALTNIRRHAQANQTDLCLRYEKNRHVSLCIQDDGVGSDKTHVGYGLVGIQERIQSLGGKVEIETSPGRGFRLCVEVAG
jgi:signal transduction histidine kinase